MTIKTPLESQVEEARHTISSDGYPMSIGELTSLYKSGELIIRPEFQRFFRWSNLQKSRLVESILLGIPLPSIFVAQNEDGVWELVDGLQRVSTILQLQGELISEPGVKSKPLKLEATKYLPALEGKVWDAPRPDQTLSPAQRLDIKRSKLDVKIIKRDSSPQAKFDLFQRLNSYGSQANAQEMRSSLLVATSPAFLVWMEALTQSNAFRECVLLSERQVEERYDLEIVTRFLVLHNLDGSQISLSGLRDLPAFLDERSIEMALMPEHKLAGLQAVFERTFAHVSRHGGEQVFRRWESAREEFKGPFLNTAFETFGLGIGFNVANGIPVRDDLIQLVQEFWSEQKKGFATGRSTEARLVEFMPLGRRLTAEI